MSKYLLKQEFLDCEIHTKTSDGTDILVTSKTFDDYFAELMIRNGQGHLIKVNPHFEENPLEKKSFGVITEELISLTSPYEQIGESLQKETVNEAESKPKRGRRQKLKE